MQITSLVFSPDGQMLLSGDAEGELMLWSLGQAKRVATFHEHHAPIWALAFSHGSSSMLASGKAMRQSEWIPHGDLELDVDMSLLIDNLTLTQPF